VRWFWHSPAAPRLDPDDIRGSAAMQSRGDERLASAYLAPAPRWS